MCGIFGCINFKGLKGSDFIEASRLLSHRGPDDEGFMIWNQSELAHFSGADSVENQRPLPMDLTCENGFIHRRLSILDLSQAGHQPMSFSERNIHLTFNGEIYNYKELIKKYDLQVSSGTDSEVILKLYAKIGTRAFEQFRGMWALGIVDLQTNELILSRDRYGIKPLYFAAVGSALAFSSEVKPLLSLKSVSAEFDLSKMLQYITFGATESKNESFFNSISAIAPGTFETIDLKTGKLNNRKAYYSLRKSVDDFNMHSNGFEELFNQSIAEHLVADVPVGSCLSGGLDSSLIVAEASRVYSGTFETFTCAFPNDPEDESGYARLLAKHASNINQNYNTPKASDFFDQIERLVEIHERPIGSASIFAQYSVMEAASQKGVKVLLDGQGADEILGGYYPFAGAYLLGLMGDLNIGLFLKELRKLKTNFNPSMEKAMLRAGYYKLPHSLQVLARKNQRIGYNLIHPGLKSEVGKLKGPQRGSSNFKELSFKSVEYGLYELLQYEDKNSMAFGIETRVPFLDHRLVEWAIAQKASDKIGGGWTKRPIRDALNKKGLTQLAWRKDKLGFVAPQKRWMTELSSELKSMLNDSSLPDFLDHNAVRGLTDSNLTSNSSLSEFWRLLSLILWIKKFKVKVV